jgi:hypothetical protein
MVTTNTNQDISGSKTFINAITITRDNLNIGGYDQRFPNVNGTLMNLQSDQTVTGSITFTVSPGIPSKLVFPVTPSSTAIATEAQVADAVNMIEIPTNYVTIDSDQTIDGTKIFNDSPIFIPTIMSVGGFDQTFPAAAGELVNTISNQTISGSKFFTTPVSLIGACTNDYHLTPKSYVDSQIEAVKIYITALLDQ